MYKYAKAFDMHIIIYDTDPNQTLNYENETVCIEDIFKDSDIFLFIQNLMRHL